ncbi:MAG: proton-conducting transporter membrane subunit [Desulfurococcus sp.]|nr:proton-conducting transporter membrane subunit [Desulfurococcus sp.]
MVEIEVAFLVSMITACLGVVASVFSVTSIVFATVVISTLVTLTASDGPACVPWLDSIPLCLGIDLVSKLFAILSSVVITAVLVYSWETKLRKGALQPVVVGLHAVVIGLVYSFSLLLFYVFWEITLLLATVIVWLWEPRRALVFFVYMHAGSLLLLVSISLLLSSGITVFGAIVPARLAGLALALALTAFAIKLGIFPFHTWVPVTYTAIPSSVAGIIAGVVTNIGAYGMYRFIVDLTWPQALTGIQSIAAWLGVVSALIGALRALASNKLDLIVSYSSVSHMGVVYAGLVVLDRLALAGGILLAIANGIVKALFFLLTDVLKDRAGTNDIRRMGLFAYNMPLTAFTAFTAAMSLAGLPPFALFPGELLVALGIGGKMGVKILVVLALAMIASTAYALRFWHNIFWHPEITIPKPPPREPPIRILMPLIALSIISIILGAAPALIIELLIS